MIYRIARLIDKQGITGRPLHRIRFKKLASGFGAVGAVEELASSHIVLFHVDAGVPLVGHPFVVER